MKLLTVITVLIILAGCWTKRDEVVWKIQDSIQDINQIAGVPGPISRNKFNNAVFKLQDLDLDGRGFSTEDKAVIGQWIYKWKLACDKISDRIEDDK